uniref:NADH-ubiquinone oxidoreductase chain 6 n=1 Tax=Platyptilia sp. DM741 TaxID=2759133 RepID=A0A7L7S0J5_9NEOP|nr:NADH dehydrogenase subunit 6 [Platyptilia sp. DM741]
MTFSLIMMFISIFMIFLTHPLSMGLMILIQTFILSLLTGMMMKTYWFSYILMLTFLGGLLVLFIYVASVASNEMFKFPFKMKILSMIMLIIMMIFILKKNNLIYMNFYLNKEMNNFFNIFFINNENKMNLSKLYNNQTYFIMLIMIIYLFITLIAVVKITNIFFGTLRSSI